MLYNVITSLRCYIMKKELVGANYGGPLTPYFPENKLVGGNYGGAPNPVFS